MPLKLAQNEIMKFDLHFKDKGLLVLKKYINKVYVELNCAIEQ
jgi:hypothetical protein